MLRSIYTYEIKSILRQPSTYFYTVVFFGIALLSILGTGGYFDGVNGTDSVVRLLNSSYEINIFFQYFNKFFLFLLPAIVGMVIYKDYGSQTHSILYSFPIKKSDYLLGKFLSGLTVVGGITVSSGLALYLGTLILGAENPMIGPTTYWGYASALFLFVWPNMIAFGLLIFVSVASLRNIYAGFIAAILLFFIQFIVDNLFEDNPILYTLLDPFGQNAVAYETRFWTIGELNTRQLPVMGMVIWNRLLWMTLSLSLGGFFYKKFRLEQESFRLFPNAAKWKSAGQGMTKSIDSSLAPTKVTVDFSFFRQLRAMLNLSAIDFRFIVKTWHFHALLLFGVLALVFAMSRVTNRADVTYVPLTRLMLSVPMHFFSIVIMLLTFVYAGMLVHRSRITKSNQLIDTTATSNWVLLGSKLLALLQVQLLLLLVMMLCGIGLQLYNGHHDLELDLYLFQLLVITLPTLVIWAALSTFVHTVVPNLYVGIFLLLLVWIGKDQMPQIGIEAHLLRFNSPPPLVYSDLNGFGHALWGNLVVSAYWLVFSAMLIVITYLFWERGYSHGPRERVRKATKGLRGWESGMLLLVVVAFCLLGVYLHWEENSPLRPVRNHEKILNDFNDRFEDYKSAEQPMIVSVKIHLDLFPETNSFRARGNYVLVNRSTKQLDTLLIKTGYDETTVLSLSVPSTIIQKDEAMQFAVHILEQSMEVGDSIQLHFEIWNKPNTLFYQNSGVLENGTFLRTDILPRLGYSFDKEYSRPQDSLARLTNFYSPDADLVDIETIISTTNLQTAIAPGTLIHQWTEDNRTYFHYKTEEKVKFAFAFNSGDFTINSTKHRGVRLEIYHQENHTYNVRDMTEGLKASLDYNTQFFGPYQHAEIRTVEFPLTEGTYASVLSNTIPTSEVRFILKNGAAQAKVNLPFYVQAHELTHQWWGNQVVPANALGAKMLTESITEYISLKIYERHFGRENAQHFLSLQRQRYLDGRTKEAGKESPLYLVRPDQEYIAYGKGAMVFNALQYYVGEEKLNSILASFLKEHRFLTDRYPTSTDLIAHLKNNIPEELHYIIRDMMETITFYDIQLVNVRELLNNQLGITCSIRKMDGTQKEKLDASNLHLTIGQFDQNGSLLHMDMIQTSTGENTFVIEKKPGAVDILLDPFLLYIELNVTNNRYNIGKLKSNKELDK
jgi:ABC-2 type transport system permease protein